MGQRLNIEIVNNDNTIANCYYHWSAYTSSSLELTKKIITAYRSIPKTLGWEGKAYMLLLATNSLVGLMGEGQATDELKTQLNAIGIAPRLSAGRNDGLISFLKDDIEGTRVWAEGTVKINIETQKIDFDVFHTINEEDVDDFGNQKIDKVVKTTEIDFNNFEDFAKEIKNISDEFIFQNEKNELIMNIE